MFCFLLVLTKRVGWVNKSRTGIRAIQRLKQKFNLCINLSLPDTGVVELCIIGVNRFLVRKDVGNCVEQASVLSWVIHVQLEQNVAE